jgi:hypothetical protein
LKQALERAGGANSFERQHHRRPALSDAEWRENVNKQLDSLGAWQRVWALQHYMSGLPERTTRTVIDRLTAIIERMVKAAEGLAEGVISTQKRISELEKLTLHAKKSPKSPFRWSADIGKLTTQLTELGKAGTALARMAATVHGFWGGGHTPPQLPPKE